MAAVPRQRPAAAPDPSATNRRGRKVRSRIIAKSMILAGEKLGVLLLMEERRNE